MILAHGGGDNMDTTDSILTSSKKLLNITQEYDHFDTDVIMYANMAFAVLNQLGVGPKNGFFISSVEQVWSDYLPDGPVLEIVKVYVPLKVKLLFDTPNSSVQVDALKRQVDELEWRLNTMVDPGETTS